MPSTFIGAALGAAITGAITLVLLSGQTEAEEVKERNVEIFSTKSKIFKEYIETLWQVWDDQRISMVDFKKLTSMYYQSLMIYLDGKKKDKKGETRLDRIGVNLSEMGLLIGKEEFKHSQTLRKCIVSIIDELSEELGIGGKINTKIMDKHDRISFPVLFKKELLDEFNKILVPNNDILKGRWEEWSEGKTLVHTCMAFYFKKYSEISVKYCPQGEDGFFWFLVVPNCPKHEKFKEFRDKGILSQRILPCDNYNWDNIFRYNKNTEDDENIYIPAFNFSKKVDENADEFEKIRKGNYRDFNRILANRAKYLFTETKINSGSVERSIPEFLEWMLKGDNNA
jgi:hypothetical protein